MKHSISAELLGTVGWYRTHFWFVSGWLLVLSLTNNSFRTYVLLCPSILCESMRVSSKLTFSDELVIPQFPVAGVLTSKQSHPKTQLRFLWSGLGYHGLHPCGSSDVNSPMTLSLVDLWISMVVAPSVCLITPWGRFSTWPIVFNGLKSSPRNGVGGSWQMISVTYQTEVQFVWSVARKLLCIAIFLVEKQRFAQEMKLNTVSYRLEQKMQHANADQTLSFQQSGWTRQTLFSTQPIEHVLQS